MGQLHIVATFGALGAVGEWMDGGSLAARVGRLSRDLGQLDAVNRAISVSAGLALLLGAGFAVAAQDAPHKRLPLTAAMPLPRDGTYVANDSLTFVVDHRDGQVRLRFADSDEVFYLSSEAAPLSGHALKYDTGAIALQVTGWGGVTLYTAKAKSGLPAEYIDVVQDVDPPPLAPADVKPFAAKLAQDLSSREDFAIGFAADWDTIAKSDVLRGLICDAMRNASLAIEEVAKAGKRGSLADRLHIVRVIQAAKSGVTVQKGILAIAIAPQNGPSARPSSLAIVRALQAAL